MSGDPPYLGIDFGTTNSSMAWFNPKTNQAEIILSEEGEQKIPSLVYYGDGGVIVGSQVEFILDDLKDRDAEERRDEMLRIVPSIKRNLISPPSIPIPGGGDVRPVEVVAEILRKLKRDAEKGHFNEEVRRAVITYPAVFDATQRKRIVEAAKLAGFHEVEMTAEPVAAAIAFAKADQNIRKGVLVYDLGGGTFDLALVVRDEDDVFRVAFETDGDPACGGDDFDQSLYDYWDKQAQRELGRSISPTAGAIDQPFLKQCRRRKENLSVREQASFSSLLPGSSKRFEPKIDRATFNQLIRERVEKTVRKTSAMMKRAKDEGLKVDDVVLIGGSSRLPLVQEMLKESLQIEPRTWMQKDIAVALGAAYSAQKIWGDSKEATKAKTAPSTETSLSEKKSEPATNPVRPKREVPSATLERSGDKWQARPGRPVVSVSPSSPVSTIKHPAKKADSTRKADEDRIRILRILNTVKRDGYYVYPNIPSAVRQKAATIGKLPPSEDVLALYSHILLFDMKGFHYRFFGKSFSILYTDLPKWQITLRTWQMTLFKANQIAKTLTVAHMRDNFHTDLLKVLAELKNLFSR